jgi:hypothetical protein
MLQIQLHTTGLGVSKIDVLMERQHTNHDARAKRNSSRPMTIQIMTNNMQLAAKTDDDHPNNVVGEKHARTVTCVASQATRAECPTQVPARRRRRPTQVPARSATLQILSVRKVVLTLTSNER